MEYPPAIPAACARWTPSTEDDVDENGRFNGLKPPAGQQKITVARSAAMSLLRIKFTPIQKFRQAELVAELGQFSTA